MAEVARASERSVGRYAICGEIAAGGMATVHVGRLLGPVGFSRTVAIKILHPQFAKDPDFLSMFLDEARLAGRIQHPNVISILDVVSSQGELFLVMDYVAGETLSRLLRILRAQKSRLPVPIALTIVTGALDGLHAAHEAKNEYGHSLGIVHRDVSPQNVLVGVDGVSRILDFGIAKAVGRMQTTRESQLKGKLAYMAPEQLARQPVDRGADIYAASIVLWELLTNQRLFQSDDEISTFKKAMDAHVPTPSSLSSGLPKELDGIVLKGLARERCERYATAREMAAALEATGLLALPREVSEWIQEVATDALRERANKIASYEQGQSTRASTQRTHEDGPITDNGTALLARLDRRPFSEGQTEIISAVPLTELAVTAPSTAIPATTTAVPLEAQSSTRKRLGVLSAAALLCLLAVTLIWWTKARQIPAAPVAGAARTAETAAPLPPSSVAPERIQPVPLASVPRPVEKGAPTRKVGRPVPVRSTRERAAVRAKSDCENPFVVDPHGVRVPKRHCL